MLRTDRGRLIGLGPLALASSASSVYFGSLNCSDKVLLSDGFGVVDLLLYALSVSGIAVVRLQFAVVTFKFCGMPEDVPGIRGTCGRDACLVGLGVVGVDLLEEDLEKFGLKSGTSL